MLSLRKKDVGVVCSSLLSLAGPFGFYRADGKPLYESAGFSSSGASGRFDVKVQGDPVGYVSGTPGRLGEVGALLGLYLEQVSEKKLLAEHTLQKYREMSFLSEINKILSSSSDINEILCATTKRVHEIINVESCSVIVADSRTGKFMLRAISGRSVNEELNLGIAEGIAGKVLECGMTIIANNPADHPAFVDTGGEKISSLLCLPLKVKEVTIGILNLRNREDGAFTSEDEALLASMCVVVAEVIENARLLEERIRDEKFAAIGQMAAGIIHDIKNPMTTIKGFAGLLGDMEFTPQERKEYSLMIINEVNRLVTMVEDLLAFTRGFKTKLSIEKVGAREFFGEVVPYIERDMLPRGIAVVSEARCDCGLRIDIERFKRVVFNIAGNAREAMHDGGKFLVLMRQASDDLVELVFSDTGKGIPEEIRETVFEPFVTKGKKSGTGLGLAVTKKIVEEHGGTIAAVNGNYSGVEGFNGANFVVSLPAESAASPA